MTERPFQSLPKSPINRFTRRFTDSHYARHTVRAVCGIGAQIQCDSSSPSSLFFIIEIEVRPCEEAEAKRLV